MKIVHADETLQGWQEIVSHDNEYLKHIGFGIIRLRARQNYSGFSEAKEMAMIISRGPVSFSCAGKTWNDLGNRKSIFDGPATGLYVPINENFTIAAGERDVEISVSCCKIEESGEPFVVHPGEYDIVNVPGESANRTLHYVFGQNVEGRTHRIVMVEEFVEAGNWMGVPPHKHDTHRPPEETYMEELYFFKFNLLQGFGVQVNYTGRSNQQAKLVHGNDIALLPNGYHPFVTLTGYRAGIHVVLISDIGRSVVQYFDPEHSWQLAKSKGVEAMRAKFK